MAHERPNAKKHPPGASPRRRLLLPAGLAILAGFLGLAYLHPSPRGQRDLRDVASAGENGTSAPASELRAPSGAATAAAEGRAAEEPVATSRTDVLLASLGTPLPLRGETPPWESSPSDPPPPEGMVPAWKLGVARRAPGEIAVPPARAPAGATTPEGASPMENPGGVNGDRPPRASP